MSFKVCFCGQLDHWPTAPDHLGIKQGMTAMGWDWSYVDPTHPSGREIAQRINEIDPDLVIHGNTDSLSKYVPPYINKNIRQVFLMLDYRTPDMLRDGMWEHWQTSAKNLDAIFISARDHIPMWEKAFNRPTFFAPHACYIPPKGLQYDEMYRYKTLWIGQLSESPPLNRRAKLIERIMQKVPVTIVNSHEHMERNRIWTDMPKYYWSSDVVLDVSHFWDNWGYCSGRYWYTATFGACAVTKRFPGCETFFPETLKWYFDSSEEAVELIKGLLNNPDEITKTKSRVASWAWKYHSYKTRFEQMMEILENI